MRFEVCQQNEVFFIKDNDAAQYKLREDACNLFFADRLRAEAVCNLLNAEWQEQK